MSELEREPVETLSYTEASRELDEIVAFFEQRDVDVDLLVTRLERASAIVDELDRRLRRTRAQVEELVPKLQGATAERAASGDEENPAAASPGPGTSADGGDRPGLFS
jgi:exodeoxyribonuclease VII small subunit